MEKFEDFEIPDFITGADNVYRTKHYIVTQFISLECDNTEVSHILSEDVFYKRTPLRDKEYDVWFGSDTYKNGKRLPCTMCSRKYVD